MIEYFKPAEFSKGINEGLHYFSDMNVELTNPVEIASIVNSGKVIFSIDISGNRKLIFLPGLKELILNFQSSILRIRDNMNQADAMEWGITV